VPVSNYDKAVAMAPVWPTICEALGAPKSIGYYVLSWWWQRIEAGDFGARP